jgi:hypothetical protein
MPTPAERIYDAAAAALVGQQARADQITSGIVPLGAAATAGGLLLKPATHDITHAQILQIVGLMFGAVGLAGVLLAGLRLLRGVTIQGVEPELLSDMAARPDVLDGTKEFDLQAAEDLSKVRLDNDTKPLHKLRMLSRVVTAGLVAEVVGFGGAALIQPRAKPTPAISPALQVTRAHLGVASLSLAGVLSSSAHGSVRVVVRLSGRTGQLALLVAAIHEGRFSLRVRASRPMSPLRSASYTIIWPGSHSVHSAELVGTITRCPEDCY